MGRGIRVADGGCRWRSSRFASRSPCGSGPSPNPAVPLRTRNRAAAMENAERREAPGGDGAIKPTPRRRRPGGGLRGTPLWRRGSGCSSHRRGSGTAPPGGGSEGRGGTPSGARGRGCGSRVFGVTFQLSAPFEGSAALGCPSGPRPYAYVCPIVPKRNRVGAERSERGTAAHRSARQPRGTRQSGRRRAPQRSRLRSRQHREDGFGTTVGRLWEGGRSGPRLPRGPREAAASSPAERPQHCAPGNGAGGVCFSSPVRLGTRRELLRDAAPCRKSAPVFRASAGNAGGDGRSALLSLWVAAAIPASPSLPWQCCPTVRAAPCGRAVLWHSRAVQEAAMLPEGTRCSQGALPWAVPGLRGPFGCAGGADPAGAPPAPCARVCVAVGQWGLGEVPRVPPSWVGYISV